ncbi:hypothetical protein GCM10027589_15250 [Actinocorallia lasiicapitis]
MTVSSPTPTLIAPDTHLVSHVLSEPEIGTLYVNTMVVLGREPVLVDTGAVCFRDQWLETTFGLVDPADVRWIFLTHEDMDHAGNLREAMDLCPNATLVTTWFGVSRHALGTRDLWAPPAERTCWIGDGETFDAGDRTFAAVRPPLFDAPTTRGLLDTSTRLYCSADSFGAFLPAYVEDARDADTDAWEEGFLHFNRMNSPWHTWLDEDKHAAHLRRIAGLGIEVLAPTHSPVLTGPMIGEALRLTALMPGLPNTDEPGRAALDDVIEAMTS